MAQLNACEEFVVVVVAVGVVAAETTAASGNRIEGSNRRNFVG